MTRIVISSDHVGLGLRKAVAAHLEARGCVVEDVGRLRDALGVPDQVQGSHT